jgi:hypothetical protein
MPGLGGGPVERCRARPVSLRSVAQSEIRREASSQGRASMGGLSPCSDVEVRKEHPHVRVGLARAGLRAACSRRTDDYPRASASMRAFKVSRPWRKVLVIMRSNMSLPMRYMPMPRSSSKVQCTSVELPVSAMTNADFA